VLEHKQELFVYLKQKWADLFGADFEVLLYDLTSAYFEGRDGTESQSQTRLQSRRQAGLPAVGDCPGGHAGWVPSGL
jgi:hypothetical protein